MHVRRTLALALAVPLLLAGCTDEPTPKIPEPTTPSPTSPSPSESESPEQESAEDFIRRWAEVDQQMFETGETELFLELGPNCDDCKNIAATVDRIYEGGGTVEWDGWTIRELGPYGEAAHTYRFVVDSAPTRYRESPSGPWKTLDGGRGVQLIVLEPVGSSWHVVESKELPE